MIQKRETGAPPADVDAARVFLDQTVRAVKVMKASWLRVALNLKRIRDQELWRFSKTPCASFPEYVHGVLEINRGVARRMLEAVGYTELRRPKLLDAFEAGDEAVHVPSYDVLDQLRRAQDAFHGREDDFAELESRVYDDGVGRMTLKREIDERLGDRDGEDDGSGADGSAGVASERAHDDRSLEGVIGRLKAIEEDLLAHDVPKEARRLLFQLVELLEKTRAKAGSGT